MIPIRNSFSDSFAKLERADELLRGLHEEIEVFRKSGPYTFSVEVDPQPPYEGANLIRAYCKDPYRVAKRTERFGVLAGEVIHHLRSALNHLVWHLVRDNSRKPTATTEFPIFESQARYEAKGTHKLAGVPEESLSLFHSVQPFNREGTADPLWRLHMLDIRDKHHVLLVTTGVLPVRLEKGEHQPREEDKFFDLRDGELVKGLWTRDRVGLAVEVPVAIAFAEDDGDRMALPELLLDCLETTEELLRTFREEL